MSNKPGDFKSERQLVDRILAGRWKKGRIPKYWDGRAAERIIRVLEKWATSDESKSRRRAR